MADRKITQLTPLLGVNAVAADELVIVDVTDTTMSASGTTKKITLAQLQTAPYTAGTVNSVAYLDGSKVLTTGSALTFDGANLGIGTSLPTQLLDVVASTGNVAARVRNDTGIVDVYALSFGDAALFSQSAGKSLLLGTVGAERMRIDSAGNVGIGTSSPSASAILDAQSTTKGVRMPNMTTTQKNAIVSPVAGLMVFDTTLSKLCVYSGAAWQTITSA